jgi:multiple sugar transport system permease protein/putative aldouronate transport system permease protein
VGIHFDNYIALKDVSDFSNSIMVTIARTVLGTALMVIVSAFAGYLTTKREMWKRSFWYRAVVVTMYFNAGLIPWYMNMLGLGLTDNFWGYILPCLVVPYNIILVKTYIESIPSSLEESATIDGASAMQVFTKIIVPLSKPILATIAVFGAVANWNSLQDSLILMANSPELYTLQHRLWIYLNTSSNLATAMQSGGTVTAAALNTKVIKYTISMVTVIPIMLVYPFMQRYFEEGIMLGAVKG